MGYLISHYQHLNVRNTEIRLIMPEVGCHHTMMTDFFQGIGIDFSGYCPVAQSIRKDI